MCHLCILLHRDQNRIKEYEQWGECFDGDPHEYEVKTVRGDAGLLPAEDYYHDPDNMRIVLLDTSFDSNNHWFVVVVGLCHFRTL